jgi:hypothetical protein
LPRRPVLLTSGDSGYNHNQKQECHCELHG